MDREQAALPPATRVGEVAADSHAVTLHVAARAVLLRLDEGQAARAASTRRRGVHDDLDASTRSASRTESTRRRSRSRSSSAGRSAITRSRATSCYEPFSGSGSQLIAAAKLGRRCYAMELAPAFVDVARIRWTSWARSAGLDPGPGALEPTP